MGMAWVAVPSQVWAADGGSQDHPRQYSSYTADSDRAIAIAREQKTGEDMYAAQYHENFADLAFRAKDDMGGKTITLKSMTVEGIIGADGKGAAAGLPVEESTAGKNGGIGSAVGIYSTNILNANITFGDIAIKAIGGNTYSQEITSGKYTHEGKAIRVKDIGTVVERSAPPTIERKDRERIVTVTAVISGAPLGSVVVAGESIIDKMDLPSGISIQVAGSYEDQQDSFSDLGTLAVLIIILVFIVMAAQFESLTYPFIIMFSIPFAFSGVLMALYGTGTTLNVMSLLGGIMLIGIVVKNGIVLIDYITLCRERGMSVIHSVVVSGRSRLRPVLMTTLTTILGMVPMAIGGGEGSEMWQPLGVSVIGGLTVSTVLTLILVPVLYCSFAGTGIKRNRKKMKAARELNDYYQAHKTEMTKGKKE